MDVRAGISEQSGNTSVAECYMHPASFIAIVAAVLLTCTGRGGLAAGNNCPYPVVDTGQDKCYDTSNELPPPQKGERF